MEEYANLDKKVLFSVAFQTGIHRVNVNGKFRIEHKKGLKMFKLNYLS